jgi:ribosomal protein S18 acetylase RimI-like enzyme
VTSEFYQLRRISIRDLTAFFGFLVGWIGSAAFAWPYLVVGWETGHFTRGVFQFLAVAFGAGLACGAGGLGLGAIAGAAWERRHRHRRTEHDASAAAVAGRPASRSPGAQSRTASPARDGSIRYENGVEAAEFLALAQRVWPRAYDAVRAGDALSRTINIAAWDGSRLTGTVRVLTDGYFFATIPEILVDPAYRRRGIGRELMRRALEQTPGGVLFIGAQPESVGFFERIGCTIGPTGYVMRSSELKAQSSKESSPSEL